MGKSAYIVCRKREKRLHMKICNQTFFYKAVSRAKALRFPLFSRLLYIKVMERGYPLWDILFSCIYILSESEYNMVKGDGEFLWYTI